MGLESWHDGKYDCQNTNLMSSIVLGVKAQAGNVLSRFDKNGLEKIQVDDNVPTLLREQKITASPDERENVYFVCSKCEGYVYKLPETHRALAREKTNVIN